MKGIDQIQAWKAVVGDLKKMRENPSQSKLTESYVNAAKAAEQANPWFTRNQVETAFDGIIRMLDSDEVEKWADKYSLNTDSPKNIGVIMAGNIPMAGFHDLFCVLLSGHNLLAKLSSSDKVLLPFLADRVCYYLPELKNRFSFVEHLKDTDAVIATGSNNTGRYFEYYFGKKPHVFRKNRNSAAVINGNENEYDHLLLGRDIFTYFGLGCRNVSKLYVPEDYVFDEFFRNILPYSYVLQHNKYMNNVDYHQALYLLNKQQFLTNNFLIIIEDKQLSSPVGVVHYETYNSESDLLSKLETVKNELQCVVRKNGRIQPGQAQFPAIDDFADGVDTMQFLTTL